jgi:hypothetical protein
MDCYEDRRVFMSLYEEVCIDISFQGEMWIIMKKESWIITKEYELLWRDV